MKVKVLVAQLCLTLCNPILYCSLPVSSVDGIFQARILKWVAISFSKESPWSRDQTQVFCIAGELFIPGKPVGRGKPIFLFYSGFHLIGEEKLVYQSNC